MATIEIGCVLTLERQKVSPVVATTLREDTNAAAVVKHSVHSIVDLSLIQLWRNKEVDTLEAIRNALLCRSAVDKGTVLGHIIAPGELLHRNPALEATLKPDLLGPPNLQYLRHRRLIIDLGQDQRATDHELRVLEVCVHASNQTRVVDRVWEVNLALRRLCRVHGSPHGHDARQASHGANELPLHGLVGDQELDSAVGFLLDDAHQHERVDELAC